MKRVYGFTMIELMVVVGIIGILSAIAIPLYQKSIQQSKATEALSVLSDLSIKMESYYQDRRTYVGASCAPPANEAKSFTYSCSVGPTATAFTIRATGVASQNMSGWTYTIDQNGVRTTSIPNKSSNNCWAVKEQDPC